jgi:hypothetical protein
MCFKQEVIVALLLEAAATSVISHTSGLRSLSAADCGFHVLDTKAMIQEAMVGHHIASFP